MKRNAQRDWDRLAERPNCHIDTFRRSTIHGLPVPARRLLTRALPEGSPLWDTVAVRMTGSIRLASRWVPFRADQILRAGTGFVWRAQVGTGLMRVSGADVMAPPRAAMDFSLWGVIPVARSHGPEILTSAAGRLAAETVAWLPQQLTPQAGARWRGLDDHRAIVVVPTPAGEIDLEVTVGGDGHLRQIQTHRLDPSTSPPAIRAFGGDVTLEFEADDVVVAGAGRVGWDWGTPEQDAGEFFQYRLTSWSPVQPVITRPTTPRRVFRSRTVPVT